MLEKIFSLFGHKKRLEELELYIPQYSFCETGTATSTSNWHIRKITNNGLKLGGGADTPSLCGRKVCWDLKVKIEKIGLEHCCKNCAKEYQKLTVT